MLYVVFIFLSFTSINTSASENITVEMKLLALDRQVDKAFLDAADTIFLDNLLTDDFYYVHAGATLIQNKYEALEGIPFAGVWSDRKRTGMDVRLHGDAAIVSGFLTVKLPVAQTYKFHIQRVYVKKRGHWKMAAQHSNFNFSEEQGLLADISLYVSNKYWSKQ